MPWLGSGIARQPEPKSDRPLAGPDRTGASGRITARQNFRTVYLFVVTPQRSPTQARCWSPARSADGRSKGTTDVARKQAHFRVWPSGRLSPRNYVKLRGRHWG